MSPSSSIFVSYRVLWYHLPAILYRFLHDEYVLRLETQRLHLVLLLSYHLSFIYCYTFALPLFLILFRFGFATSGFFYSTSLCFFFFIDRGLGPFTIFVFSWMPFSEDNCLIIFFFSISAFCLLSWLISFISFYWGKSLLLFSFCKSCNSLRWISSIVTLWSGPTYIIGTFLSALSCRLSYKSWEHMMYCL